MVKYISQCAKFKQRLLNDKWVTPTMLSYLYRYRQKDNTTILGSFTFTLVGRFLYLNRASSLFGWVDTGYICNSSSLHITLFVFVLRTGSVCSQVSFFLISDYVVLCKIKVLSKTLFYQIYKCYIQLMQILI